MIRSRSTLIRFASLFAAGAVLVSACETPVATPFNSPPPPEPTIAPRTSASLARPEVVVRKGTIEDSMRVLGRVVSSQDADLYFKTTNRLRGIYVETGQDVKAGDLLAEQETGDLVTRLNKAKATMETAQIALDKAKAKTVQDDTTDQQTAIQVAQVNVEQANLALEKLQSGVLESDKKSAEAGVAQAQAALEKAKVDLANKQQQLVAKQAELDYKQTGATPDAIAAAQADVETKRVALEKAQSVAPKPEDIQAAQIKLDQAKTKLAQLRDAPPVKPEDINAAELAERAAEIKLEQVRSATGSTTAQHDADVRTAELNVDAAKAKLEALKNQTPNPWDVRLAEQAVTAAENDVARAKAQSAQQPYDVKAAQIAYDLANSKLEALKQGPSDDDLAQIRNEIASLKIAIESANVAIPSAQAAITAAQAKLDAVVQGPSDLDVQDQQLKVQKTQLDVERAKAQLDVAKQTIAASKTANQFDVQSLQKDVEKAKIDLDQLQQNYDDSRILAPYNGKITKVNGKSGDNVQAFNPVISISSPDNLLVNVQIGESDMPRLAIGQKALITLDAFPGQTLTGSVLTLPSTVVTQQGVVADKNTKIAVNWTRPGAQIGMNVRVQIIVQKKDDVLLVPTQAIRSVGRRRFVEYMDGNVKRSRNVETGISTDTDTEILSGLDEGMSILAGS